MSFVNFAGQLDAIDERVRALEELLGVNRKGVVETEAPGADVELATVPNGPEVLPEPVVVRPSVVMRPVARVGYTVPALQVSMPTAELEQMIGLKLAGWVGAIVLVIGAAFGIRFGYDQGWFSIVTPAVRLGLLTIAGFGLIAAGEWVYRKVNVLSAVGLFGAGIAMLFVISYAGHAYYGLYEPNTAFAFMVVSMLIGVAVARRGRMASIAVLAMIGGNLAPLLLGIHQAQFVGFFIYLLVLQRTSLLLATWGDTPRWWTLRGLSLAGTSLWVASVIDLAPMPLTLVFVLLFAALFHYELNMSAHRSRFKGVEAGVTFSLLVTGALALALFRLEWEGTQTIRLFSVLGMSAVTGSVSLLNYLWRKKSPLVESLAVGYAIQSLALLAVAVPIALSGVWIGLAWSVLAIACAAAGRTLDLLAARNAALAGWTLAAMHLAWWISLDRAVGHRVVLVFTFNGCHVPPYLLMSFSLAITGQIIARLVGSEIGRGLSVVNSAIWIAASVGALSDSVATASILLYAMLLLLADQFFEDETTMISSVVITGLATMKWAIVDTLVRRLDATACVASPIFCPRQLVGIGVLASLTILYRVADSRKELTTLDKNPKRKIAGLMVGVIFWWCTFAIDQMFINQHFSSLPMFINPEHGEQVALSVFWSGFALASVVIGLVQRVASLRYFGLTLFAVTLLKVVTIDLSQIGTGYRILSFMALGLLLLGTSVLYGKMTPQLLDEAIDLDS